MLEAAFWLSLLVGIYPYLAYPVLVQVLGGAFRKRVRMDVSHQPTITVVIAAYNEAAHIESTVRNKLGQAYPSHLVNVIVVSDESSDNTDDIVASIASEDDRVMLLRQDPRQGKTAALNLAIPRATGEIIVFSDANSVYAPDALRHLAAAFSDPEVGYASGHMKYVNAEGSPIGDGCTAYMRYENRLRAAETLLGSIVGVDGGVDAVRRSLFRPMRADQLPDFVLPLSIVEQGYRVVFVPGANLHEESLTTGSSEFRMRVRVALRAYWALWDKRSLLNPFKYGIFSWQLLSHKVLRYLAFVPLASAAMLNWLLIREGGVYLLTAFGQVAFAAFVLAAALRKGGGIAIFCQYFLLLNVASAIALAKFLSGEKRVLWQPRQG